MAAANITVGQDDGLAMPEPVRWRCLGHPACMAMDRQDGGGEHSPLKPAKSELLSAMPPPAVSASEKGLPAGTSKRIDPEDVVEICHIYKYINVGLHGNPDHFNTICFVEKMQEPDTHNCRPIIFVSRKVTPEHGQWTLTVTTSRGGTELILNFNARFGQSGFEDPPLWPVRLLRRSDATKFVWQGHDRNGSRIVLERLESLARGSVGWWESAETL